ncbi:MAG: hypothetical protein AAF830_09255 [Pseudomonadota bacterium]
MTDLQSYTPSLTSPPSRGTSVTPSDSADLPYTLKAFMVSVAGDVSVLTTGGDVLTLPACQPGLQYAVLATRLRATGTTASGIVGLGD